MRETLLPMLGAIGAGVSLSASTPIAPNDVYAWRWTVDTVLDAQKKAFRRDATLAATAPNDSKEPSWSFADRSAPRDIPPFPFGGT